MIIPAIFFIFWDSWFTRINVWQFNEDRITGIRFFHLPLEEILFFFIVPYCCLFIYECIRTYFPGLKCTKHADYLLGFTGLVLLIFGFIYRDKLYTATTFSFTSLFIAILLAFRNFFHSFHTTAFLISYGIILLPFLFVNGFLTAIPVVLYNDNENLGIRIYTIPFEDIFYGMLLVMMNITFYEMLRQRKTNKDNIM
jgi:lycopene cyclase domain-containing protein